MVGIVVLLGIADSGQQPPSSSFDAAAEVKSTNLGYQTLGLRY